MEMTMSNIDQNGELYWKSACEIRELIRKKEVSPVEIVKETLDRIDAVNPKINSYVTICADNALSDAKHAEDALFKKTELGILHGIPFSVKDVTLTKNVRTTMGSKLMESFIPSEDAVLVSRLKEAGAYPIPITFFLECLEILGILAGRLEDLVVALRRQWQQD
jgi:aspartyl-tRNA(Asn)/glutamyl-tRNA(Gln) amidotransferase subunit A